MDYSFKPEHWSSHNLLLRILPQAGNGLRLLDVGCAGGYLDRLLMARGFEVVGIDKEIDRTREVEKGLVFVNADLDSGLPPLPRPFSFILCADILEHLRDPIRLLQELHSMLRPDGLLIASLPNSGNIYVRLNVLMGRFPLQERGLFDRTHLHFFTWNGWVSVFKSAGFLVEEVGVTPIPFGLAFPRWRGTFLVRTLEALSYGAARIWGRLFAYQFIVVARATRT